MGRTGHGSSEEDEDEIISKRKANKGKEKKTYVFEIELTEYTNDSYAEYNLKDLVQKEEDKDRYYPPVLLGCNLYDSGLKILLQSTVCG